jgi:hypothetical protein
MTSSDIHKKAMLEALEKSLGRCDRCLQGS